MEYIAIYKLTTSQKQDIVQTLRDVINGDGYYPMFSHEGGKVEMASGEVVSFPAGSGLKRRRISGSQWADYKIAGFADSMTYDSETGFIESLSWEDLLKGRPYGWSTCRGNIECFEIVSDDTIRYTRKGMRHGIPNNFSLLAGIKPANVVRYDSKRKDETPFVCGLEPTPELQNRHDYIMRKQQCGISADAALRQYSAEF